MGHADVLLNTGFRILLNTGGHLLLNAQGSGHGTGAVGSSQQQGVSLVKKQKKKPITEPYDKGKILKELSTKLDIHGMLANDYETPLRVTSNLRGAITEKVSIRSSLASMKEMKMTSTGSIKSYLGKRISIESSLKGNVKKRISSIGERDFSPLHEITDIAQILYLKRINSKLGDVNQ